ncbi:putative polycomb protein, VEFS-Box [Helianthus annuus]|nr:putative polycomb protein, VEFS-Box [Helianthus annuus]
MAPARMFAKDNSEGVVDNVVANFAKDNSEGMVDNVVANFAKDNSEGVVDNAVANFAKDNSEGVVDNAVANFAKDNSEGVVENVVANIEDSMCSIEPTTLPQARNKSLLEGRQFFHSRTFQPMSSEYLFGDEDSDDEVDDEIAELEEKRRLDRFVDATQHEKRLMLLWNSFKRKQRCWNVFMVKLWEIGLLDANTMNNCGSILGQNSEKKN